LEDSERTRFACVKFPQDKLLYFYPGKVEIVNKAREFGSPAKGFVELPHTLPQDFTLFVLMKERNIDIWKKKIDWIIEKGGMALSITHPDYMNFSDTDPAQKEYPAPIIKNSSNILEKNTMGNIGTFCQKKWPVIGQRGTEL